MKYLKEVYDYLGSEYDDAKNRILNDFMYRLKNENILEDLISDLTEYNIVDYLNNTGYANIKNSLYNIANIIVSGVVKQDINDYIAENVFINIIYDKLPSTTSNSISDFADEIMEKCLSGNDPPLYDFVLETIFPKIFDEIEEQLLEFILIELDAEPAQFKKLENLKLKYLPIEKWKEFLNKIFKNKPQLKRSKDSGLLDTKLG